MNSGKIAVVGAGSWGTALAHLLAGKKFDVVLWGRDGENLEGIEKERINKKYLPDVVLHSNIRIEKNIQKAVEGAFFLIMAVPSHAYRDIFQHAVGTIENDSYIVSAVKGMENSSLQTMTQVMGEILSERGRMTMNCGVLSGPSFAEEVSRRVPTAVTVGFKDIKKAQNVQKILVTDYFRVYASSDVIGLEISSSIKNIIAIATGVCDGLGYGLNTRAALITRGLAEMQRLGVALGAEPATFSGLSGMGDLILTCTGSLSRNRTVGIKLGEGKKIARIQDEMNMVAEGIKTTLSVHELAFKMGVDMPILEQVYKIIYEGKDCGEAVADLLKRELKVE
jgi:glycerol-3-phosphate dehydrogenase (NAD(P)+)